MLICFARTLTFTSDEIILKMYRKNIFATNYR